MKRTKFKKNVQSIFNGYGLKEILEEINKLDPKRKEIFYKEYTTRYNGEKITELTDEEKKINYRTKYKIIKNIERKANPKPIKKLTPYKELFSIFESEKKEDVIKVIKTLNKRDRDLLYKKYGSDLSNTTPKPELTERERKEINTRIIKNIKNRLRLIKTTHTIITYKDIFPGLDINTLKEKISKLSNTDKKRITNLFKEDLTDYVFISKKNKNYLLNSEVYLKLAGKENKKERLFHPLLDSFKNLRYANETDEELLNRIKANTEILYLDKLKKKYGENLNSPMKCSNLTKEEKREILNIVSMIKYNMKKSEKEKEECKPLMDRVFPLLSYDEIIEWSNTLTKEKQDLLKKIYKDNLLGRTINKEITKEESQELNKILLSLNNKTLAKKQKLSGISVGLLRKIKILTQTKEYKYLESKYGVHRSIAILMNRYMSYYCTHEQISRLTNVEISVITALTLNHLMSGKKDLIPSFYKIKKTLKMKI